jgi:MFS family permease
VSAAPLRAVVPAAFAVFLSFFLLLSVLPLYARALGVADGAIGVVMGAFALSAMVLRPWAGWAADRYGRRPLMLAGSLLFVLASPAYALAAGAAGLTAVRLLHGAGMGLFPTAASAVVTDLAPPHRRGHMLGLYGATASVAMAVGPVTGVALVQHWGFAPLFALSGVIAAGGVAWTLSQPETLRDRRAFAFDPRSVLERSALFPGLVVLCLMLTYGAQVSFLPLHADAQGVNPGVFFLVFALVVAVVRGVAGRLSDRVGRSHVAAAGLVVTAAALAVQALTSGATALALAGALYGIGFGTAQPAIMAWSVDAVDPGRRGRAMGTFYTALELGIAIGAMSAGLAVGLAGFTTTFLGAAAAALAGATLAVARPSGGRPAST